MTVPTNRSRAASTNPSVAPKKVGATLSLEKREGAKQPRHICPKFATNPTSDTIASFATNRANAIISPGGVLNSSGVMRTSNRQIATNPTNPGLRPFDSAQGDTFSVLVVNRLNDNLMF